MNLDSLEGKHSPDGGRGQRLILLHTRALTEDERQAYRRVFLPLRPPLGGPAAQRAEIKLNPDGSIPQSLLTPVEPNVGVIEWDYNVHRDRSLADLGNFDLLVIPLRNKAGPCAPVKRPDAQGNAREWWARQLASPIVGEYQIVMLHRPREDHKRLSAYCSSSLGVTRGVTAVMTKSLPTLAEVSSIAGGDPTGAAQRKAFIDLILSPFLPAPHRAALSAVVEKTTSCLCGG